MSNFVWCHGPSCHKSHTQDRIRGVKGSKVLRTKKVPQTTWNSGQHFNMEWILLGMITTLIVVGLTFARSTQDYIDEQNERIRQHDKWRKNND